MSLGRPISYHPMLSVLRFLPTKLRMRFVKRCPSVVNVDKRLPYSFRSFCVSKRDQSYAFHIESSNALKSETATELDDIANFYLARPGTRIGCLNLYHYYPNFSDEVAAAYIGRLLVSCRYNTAEMVPFPSVFSRARTRFGFIDIRLYGFHDAPQYDTDVIRKLRGVTTKKLSITYDSSEGSDRIPPAGFFDGLADIQTDEFFYLSLFLLPNADFLLSVTSKKWYISERVWRDRPIDIELYTQRIFAFVKKLKNTADEEPSPENSKYYVLCLDGDLPERLIASRPFQAAIKKWRGQAARLGKKYFIASSHKMKIVVELQGWKLVVSRKREHRKRSKLLINQE